MRNRCYQTLIRYGLEWHRIVKYRHGPERGIPDQSGTDMDTISTENHDRQRSVYPKEVKREEYSSLFIFFYFI